jgi:hypothetical protein
MSMRSIFEVRIVADGPDFGTTYDETANKVAEVLDRIAKQMRERAKNDDLKDSHGQPFARYGFYHGQLYDDENC